MGDGHSVEQLGGVGDQAAMAVPPQGLGAHHGRRTLARLREQPVHGGAELGRRHVVGVRAERAVMKCGVGRVRDAPPAPAQRLLPAIPDARLAQPSRHRLARELGVPPAGGEPADVDDRRDLRRLEQRDERLGGERPVPDREQRRYGPAGTASNAATRSRHSGGTGTEALAS